MQTIKEVVILYFWSSLLPVLRWPKASHLDSNKWESHPNSAPPILTLHHRVTPATFSSLLVICSYNSEILDLQRSKGWMLGSICLSVSFTFFISVSMIITICHFRNICFIKQYFFSLLWRCTWWAGSILLFTGCKWLLQGQITEE